MKLASILSVFWPFSGGTETPTVRAVEIEAAQAHAPTPATAQAYAPAPAVGQPHTPTPEAGQYA